MRRVKRALLLFLTLSSTLLLGGCLHSTQLNERAIVQAIGIDLEGDQIKLTLQVFSPASSGGSSIGATAENAKIIEASGATVSEAVQNANLMQGKQLFVGHNRIIIIGEALAQQGIEQPLSYFSASSWSRQNVHLVVAEEKAGDILSAKINQGMLPAETLEKIVINSEDNGLIKNVKMFEFVKALDNKHESSILPIMRVNQKKEEGSGGESGGGGGAGKGEGQGGSGGQGQSNKIEPVSSIELVGTAIFVDAKMVGSLGREASRGLLWIHDSIKETEIITSTEKYKTASLRVYQSKSKLIPKVSDKKIHFTLQVHCEAMICESMLREGQKADYSDIESLARAGEKEIENESRAAFQKAVKEYGADIFNFGDLVWQKDVDIWREVHTNWPEELKKISFAVEAKMELDRVGLEVKRSDKPQT